MIKYKIFKYKVWLTFRILCTRVRIFWIDIKYIITFPAFLLLATFTYLKVLYTNGRSGVADMVYDPEKYYNQIKDHAMPLTIILTIILVSYITVKCM